MNQDAMGAQPNGPTGGGSGPQPTDRSYGEPTVQFPTSGFPGEGHLVGGGAPGQPPTAARPDWRAPTPPGQPFGEPVGAAPQWPAPAGPANQPSGTLQPGPKAGKPHPIRYAVVLLVLSSLVGGGTAYGVTKYLTSERYILVSSSSPTAVVVQGSSNAPNWSVTAAQASKSTVSIQVVAGQGTSSGSGVVLDTEGNIVTNNHVVGSGGSQSRIIVQIGDRRFSATVVGTDPSSDLAVIRLESPPKDLAPMPFADSDKVVVGDPVMAIGNPLGLSGTVTTGIVSALNRPVATTSGQQPVVSNAIQTSAAINPGNSGGALVNANGELIGINTAIASLGAEQGTQSGNIGIGFAIESNLVKTVTKQIIRTGTANHAWLGVSAKNDAEDLDGSAIVGARVTEVSPDSPAVKAGLTVGDLITAISGKPVSSLESLVAVVRAQDIGEEVEISVVRAGKLNKVKTTLVESPRVR